MDIVKLLTSVILQIAVQAAILFVFHNLRGPFKELGILQKDMLILREKTKETNRAMVQYVTKKWYYKRKTSVSKSRSRSSRNSSLYYRKVMGRIDDLKERSTPLQFEAPTEQACTNTGNSNASEAKIQDLERAYYDLDTKMKHFKRRTRSNQLLIKDYAKSIKEYAKNIQADQDELRRKVGHIFYSLEDEMSLLDDDMEIRLSSVESRVLALIEEKLKVERRKG